MSVVALTAMVLLVAPAYAATVTFADANLEAAVRAALVKPSGSITDADMLTLTTLDASHRDIVQLGGLEYATNLDRLDLNGNQIASLTPVAGLTKLTYLDLGANQITDITPVANLTKLTSLQLPLNKVTSAAPVAGLTKLGLLNLAHNDITSITPVAGLTNLEYLQLAGNEIADITPLVSLTKLTSLFLWGNHITSITPVAGLTELKSMDLNQNQIASIAPLASLTKLTNLQLDRNRITSVSAVAGLTALTSLSLGYNQISEIAPVAGLTSLTSLRLRYNNLDLTPGSPTMTTIATVLGRGATVDYQPQNPISSCAYGFAANATSGWHNAGQTLTITMTGSADLWGRTIHYSLDGGATWAAVAGVSATVNVSVEGSHHVKYYANDSMVTEATHDAGYVNIDKTGPTTTALAKVSAKKGKSATFRFKVSDRTPTAQVTIKISQGRKLKTSLAVGAKPCGSAQSYAWKKCTLPPGTYTWKVYATDAAGNKQVKIGSQTLSVK
jgi:Leucine-rich repeat (LRR) protein